MRGNSVGRNWLMKWDELKKFPCYTHRLMHRKRVTCELHDSYFHLMTIKHSISKIEWPIEWPIEWVLNYYITQSRRKLSASCSRVGESYRREGSGKPHPAERALGNPDGVWGPERLLIRCSKESQHPAELTPGTTVEHQENEKDTTLTAISLGVKIFQFCSVSSSLSLWNPTQPFRTLAIKWEVNILLK